MDNIYAWTDDPEYDEERYFHDEDREDWDERIDRLRDERTLDDWDHEYERRDW